MVPSPHRVPTTGKFKLAKINTAYTGRFKDKQTAATATRKLSDKLGDLQDRFYAEAKRALLVVLQAMDTGGKDGTIKSVFDSVDPQGCQVTSFKSPSTLELAHDYLWRIHAAAPAKGMIGIFNRSHYESLLVERVRQLVPRAVWRRRYAHVNEFERILTDEGTVILKFFLHISKDEQKRRLESRLSDSHKNWKFDPADLAERKRWDDYQHAYEDALRKTSTDHAPWYVIPADKKWYRNWAVSDVIVRTLEKLNPKYPPPKPGIAGLIVE